jgi:hypothetical protein
MTGGFYTGYYALFCVYGITKKWSPISEFRSKWENSNNQAFKKLISRLNRYSAIFFDAVPFENDNL